MAELRTEKGHTKLSDRGYYYVKSKDLSTPGHSSWTCEKRDRLNCRGRVRVVNGIVTATVTDHNHGPDASRRDALAAVQEVRYRASQTQETTRQILAAATTNVNPAAAAKLPSECSLKQTIQCQRNIHNNIDPQPADLHVLQFPEQYLSLANGTRFLIHDSGPGDDRIIIFSTAENLVLLVQSREWFADGTFKVTPQPFHQLYTIHARLFGSVIPLVFVLMPNRTRETYRRVLHQLKFQQPGLNPQHVMMDFEMAAIGAFRDEFPDVECSGCFFHLCQNVYRHVINEGLKGVYETDADFATCIRCIPAIALMRENDIEEAFDALVSDLNFDQRCMPIADYFEDTYVGRPQRRGRRRPPTFPHTLWNVHNRTLQDMDRTNNHIEGWHRSFQTLIGAQIPNIFRFVQKLKEEQMLNENQIARLVAGQPPNPKRRRYQDLNERIINILESYDNRTYMQLLRGISYCFNF